VRGILAITFLCFLVVAVDGQALSPVFPQLARQFQVDPGRVILVSGAFQLALMFGPYLAPRYAGKEKSALIAGVAIFIAGSAISAYAASFTTFLAARFVTGMASALFVPAASAYLAGHLAGPGRGRGLGLVRSAWSLAGVAGIPLAVKVIGEQGSRIFFAGLALAGILCLGLTRRLPAAVASPRWEYARGRPGGAVLAIAWLTLLGPTGVFFFLAVHQKTQSNWSAEAVGYLFAGCAAAGLAGGLMGGWLADRCGKRRIAGLGISLLALIMMALRGASGPWQAAAWATAMTFSLELSWVAFQAWILELPGVDRGRAVASANLGYGMGGISMAAAGAWLWDHGGMAAVATSGMLAAMAAVALVLRAPTESRP
jgi:DHA1 family inner membrane transport protein